VAWDRPADEVARALGDAVRGPYLAPASDGRTHVYRLAGEVTGRRVELRVSFSQAGDAGVEYWPIRLAGEIRAAGQGSALDAVLEMPGAQSRLWPVTAMLLLVATVLAPVAGLGWGAVAIGVFGLVAIVFSAPLRARNLRRYAADLERILADLGASGPPDRSTMVA